ncbi:hypothetical protein ACO0QE_003332 [Hanseniaspora vineae]
MLNSYAENELLPQISTLSSSSDAELKAALVAQDKTETSKLQQQHKVEADQYLQDIYKKKGDAVNQHYKSSASLQPTAVVDGTSPSTDLTNTYESEKPVQGQHNIEKGNEKSEVKEEAAAVFSSGIDLTDMETLLEKNKYYPLLQEDFYTELFDHKTIEDYSAVDFSESEPDLSDVSANLNALHKKHKYLLVENAGIKKSFQYVNKNYPKIQAVKYSDQGLPNTEMLKRIEDVFKTSYNLYTNYAFGADEVQPLTKKHKNNGNGFANTLLGSLDMLYLLNMKEELSEVVEKLTDKPFKSDKLLIHTNQLFASTISALMSAFELSEGTEPLFLEKAKLFAQMGIKSFDTPNNLPLTDFPWKSKLQNRFPLKHSNFWDIAGAGLELTKISMMLKDNIYYSTAHSVFSYIQSSNKKFHVDYLFPQQVDASGCKTLGSNKLTDGSHLGLNVMKSIAKGDFIFCEQVTSLLPANYDENQKYQFNSKDGSSNYYFDLLKMYHLLNGHDDSLQLLKSFVNAANQIQKFMVFKPVLPGTNKDILAISSFESSSNYSPIKNTHQVSVKQTLQMDYASCQAGAMFMLASKLLKNETYATLGANLINGCTQIPECYNSKILPESIVLEKCHETAESCLFDPDSKLRKLLNDEYFVSDAENPESFEFSGIKVENTDDFAVPDMEDNEAGEVIPMQKQGEKELAVGSADVDKEPQAKLEKRKAASNSWSGTQNEATSKKNYHLSVIASPNFAHRKFSSDKPGVWSDWVGLPFFLNDADAQYLLKPDIIESLFYAYRVTGDASYRAQAERQFELMIQAVLQVHGKGRMELSALSDVFSLEVLDSLPHYWFSKTLKYYHLISSSTDVLSLDDYVFNSDGHPFARHAVMNDNLVNEYAIDWETIFD